MTDERRRSRPAEAEVAGSPLQLEGVAPRPGSSAEDDALTDRILGGPPRTSARPPQSNLPQPHLSAPPVRLSEPAPSSRRMRAQVLRIPDDEVARPDIRPLPQSRFPPAAVGPDAATLPNLPYIPPDPRSVENVNAVAPDPVSAPDLGPANFVGALVPSRIISIGVPSSAVPKSERPQAIAHAHQPQHASLPPATPPKPQAHFGIDSLNNESWTPYQPKVAERPAESEPDARRQLSTSSLQDFVDDSDPEGAVAVPSSEDIPVDIAVEVADDSEDPTQVIEPLNSTDAERVLANLPPSGPMRAAPPPRPPMPSSPGGFSSPRPPLQSTPSFTGSTPPPPNSQPPAAPPLRSAPPKVASTPPAPSAPPSSASSLRGPSESSSGDAPELSSEDLVSIESLPAPPHASTMSPMRAPARSNPAPIELSPSGHMPAAPPSPPPHTSAPNPPAASPPSAPTGLSAGPSAASVSGGNPVAKAPPAAAAGTTGTASAGSAIAPPAVDAATAAAAATKKPTRRPWWEELFGDDYLRTQAKLTAAQIKAESDFIEESLGVQRGAMVLDLACGTGLQAIELTRRGYQVVGFDLSLSMLAKAADEAQERAQKINFVQGDMREMTFENTFDGVYSWNTSFGYFDEEKNAQVIGNVQRALRKGGQFLLDVANRDYLMRQAPSLAWFEGEGCICMDEMNVDPITSRMKVKRTMMIDDGRSKEIEYSVRLYTLHELGKLLNEHGFRVAEVSGRIATPGVYFGAESPRTLILAEKR